MLFDGVNIDGTYGTGLVTFTAADTFVVVHRRTEVIYAYCLYGTGLYAFHTADTAGLALLTSLSTLVVITAENSRLCGVEGEQVDKLSGTGRDTFFTGTALVGVDSGHTVTDEDSLVGAYLCTVTVADTAVNAVFRTAEKLCSHFTGVNTAVFQLVLYVGSVTLTHYGGNHGSYLTYGKSHNFTYLLGGVVTAGGTEVTFACLTLGQSGGIAVTACEAAGTAVGTGETLSDFFGLFVYGYGENDGGDSETETCNKSDNCDDNYSDNNLSHLITSLSENVFYYSRKAEEGNGNE